MKFFLLTVSIIYAHIWIIAQDNNFKDRVTQKQIITDTMIKQAGIQSLSDIFYLADKWDFYTIDGYEKGFSANSLSSFQRQNFIIMLDGQLIDDRIFDIQNINQIPISIDQVDYVVLINTPQIYNGEFSENGLIDIHTKIPTKGLSLHGYNGVGEQTGKTGPYITTKFEAKHVDKLGYYLSGDASYSSNNWYLETATKIEQNFDTDIEISNRISNLFPEYNKAKLYSSYYKFSINMLGGNQQIIAGSTRHNDFFFFNPYGDEIPVNRYFKHIGINGTLNPFQNAGLNYAVTYSINQMNQWENRQNLNFDWQMENYYANLEGNFNSEFINATIGAGYKKIKGSDFSTSFSKAFVTNRAYSSIIIKLANDMLQSLDFYSIRVGSTTALKAAIKNSWDIDSKSNISSSYTFSERLLIEDANYWFWNAQGYEFSAPGFYNPNILGNFNTTKLFTFDINYKLKIDTALKIESSILYRNFTNYYIEEQSFQFTNSENSFFAPENIFTGADLGVIGFQAGIEYKLTSFLSQKLFYTFQKDIWGSQQFRDIWHELPVHKFKYSIDYEPVRDLGIWVNMRYSSSTDWVDYKYSGNQTQNEYQNKVKPIFNIDMSIQKWLWDRRIWLNVLFRNIFNQSENYIPIGISSDLRFYLSGQLYFNSLL